MATGSVIKVVDSPDLFQIEWTLTTADPNGDWVQLPRFADRTLHLFASSWGGATATFQGSCERGTPTAPQTLTDFAGNPLNFTANGPLKLIQEAPLQIRCILSVVGAGATVQVRLTMGK